MIYALTLNPALDRSIAPDAERMDPGGKGLNVAKTLSSFHIPAVAVAFIAGETGQLLCRLAREAGINLHSIPTAGQTRVNLKLFDGKAVTEHNQAGPDFDAAAFEALLLWLKATLKPGDTLALCGSLPPKAPINCYALIANTFANCRIIIDTSGPALRAALCAKPKVIKPNLAELQTLVGHSLPDDTSRVEALRSLAVERVLLSLGAEGAMLSAPDGVWYAPAPKVPVRGTVGAGDAMTAVLCHYPLDNSAALLRACVAAGSAAAMQPGSVPPTRQDWEALMRKIVPIRR